MKVSQESEVTESNLSDLVNRIRDTVRRRWLTLLVVTAALFAIGVGLIFMMTPQYSAVAAVRIDPTRSQLTTDTAATALTLTPEAIETEVSIIKSDEVARTVVKNLKLDTNPLFTKGLDKMADRPMSVEERQSAIAATVLRNLDVARDKLTYILQIRYTSPDGTTAARIANAFAEAYIYTKVGSKVDNAQRKSDWYKQQLDDLGGQIRAAEAQVAQYRAESGISIGSGTPGSSPGGTIVDQEIAPLSQQLAVAQSEAAAARAQLAAAETQAAKGGPDAVAEVLNSAVIGDLRRQRAEILRNMGEVQARYGEKHPEAVRVRDQLAGIDAQINDEIKRVMGSLRSAAAAADARAASLQQSMGSLAGRQSENTRKAVLANSLESEIAIKRSQYEKTAQLAMDTAQASNNSIAQAEIVDTAKAPSAPTSPNKPLLIALALAIALAAGIGTIAVQEMMVSGLRSVDDIEKVLGISMLAAIPKVSGSRPADLLLDRPTSAFAEALRLARASILGVRSAKPPQVIAITSALPSEGKTTTALAFARTLAMNGSKTLLLECDVRRAVMAKSVKVAPEGPGIVEVLHHEATIDQAIHSGDVEGLDQMLVSRPYFSSGNLFGDGNMEALLTTLRGRYELIVLDLPPLLGLADGRFLAAMSDVVAMVIRWDSTPAQAAQAALSSLQSDGANIAGAIFTMVDTGAEAVGALYYSKKYSGYYQAA